MTRIARALAIVMVGIALMFVLGEFVLYSLPRANPSRLDASGGSFFPLMALEFVAVGAFIIWRRPRHPIGWILAAPILAFATSGALSDYAEYGAVAAPGSLPGAQLIGSLARITGADWVALLVPVTFGMLLFTDGRLVSTRWRPVAWLAAAVIVGEAAITTGNTVAPGIVPGWLQKGASWTMIATIAACVASIVVRFRRAHGEQRQQLKWVASAAGAVALVLALSGVGSLVAPTFMDESGIGNVVFPLAWSLIPVAIAIAVLRYRLYDIDLVINRALVYGATTVTLAAAFAGAQLLLQTALRPVTAGNDLAVAGSTLLIAGLFVPLRARIREAVDRRFYRSRYDARRTVEGFTARLRHEIDLDALRAELLVAVRDTIRPAHASVWLREP